MPKTVTLRLSDETYEAFFEASKAENRSMANLIETAALAKIREQQFVDDVEMAEIYEGLIRNLFIVSHADNATDYAADYVVECGMGCWRIDTEYVGESFNQDIVIKGIENPFNLYCDPAAREFMKRDALDWA